MKGGKGKRERDVGEEIGEGRGERERWGGEVNEREAGIIDDANPPSH